MRLLLTSYNIANKEIVIYMGTENRHKDFELSNILTRSK